MERALFRERAHLVGVSLSEEQVDSFMQFEESLYASNEVMNLTRVPRDECWIRHFLDSLLLNRFLSSGSTVLDIGSGPGFPAWPMACSRPDVEVTAMDSSGKMLGFLRRHPLANLRIVQGRAEDLKPVEIFDLVTGRAIAPLPIQLELSAGPCKVGGRVVAMRTPNDVLAIESFVGKGLGLQLEGVEYVRLPGTEIDRVFPVYHKVVRTEQRFPRSWAEIRRQPLN